MTNKERQKQKLAMKEGTFYSGGREIKRYSFLQNYYFMVGDKVMNSQNSRYWGALPEEFIVGKATFIWKSKELTTGEME